MKDVLIQQKFSEALKDEVALPATMLQANKTEMVDRAMSVIVLCHKDKVFRDVVKETTTTLMWSKLESLNIIKSFSHRQFLKQELYSFWMVEPKTITKQLTESNKILDDLVTIKVDIEDEDKDILLL